MEEKTTNHRNLKNPFPPYTHTQIHNRITEWSIQLIEEEGQNSAVTEAGKGEFLTTVNYMAENISSQTRSSSLRAVTAEQSPPSMYTGWGVMALMEMKETENKNGK